MSFHLIHRGMAIIAILLAGVSGFAQTPVEEHWSPYDYPREIPEGTQYHIIVDGDTLWDLAGRYLNDPLLWPQLYQANAYILDPDLIYPGDPIFLVMTGVVVDEGSIAEDLGEGEGVESGEFTDLGEPGDGESGEGADDFETVGDVSEVTSFDGDASEFVILPAGDRSDMECSTYLYPVASQNESLPFDFFVAGGENKLLVSFGAGDIVYLNKGRENGINPGDVFSARRMLRNVYDPEFPRKTKFIGYAIDQVGKIKILAVQAMGSTGFITDSCQEIRVDDFLVPFEQEPIPLITELPAVNRYEEFPKEGAGSIVLSEDDIYAIGKGHITNINLGIENNVAPGDLFIIYRPNPANDERKNLSLPEIYLGHGVALKTGVRSTVMKIIESYTDMHVGDRVVSLTGGSF